MGSTCILTDSAAQFPQLGFSGRNDVRVVPFSVEIEGKLYEEGHDLHTNDLPATANDALHPRLIAPTAMQFEELYLSLNQHYKNLMVILTSSSLSSALQNANRAAEATRGRAQVTVIDSQTTSVGLGLLVQLAAEAVASGRQAADIERMVRSMIPHTYGWWAPPSL